MTKIEKEVAKALDVSIASLINSEHETLVRSNSEDEYVLHMNRSENWGQQAPGCPAVTLNLQASQAKCQKIMQPESLPRVYGIKQNACKESILPSAQLLY